MGAPSGCMVHQLRQLGVITLAIITWSNACMSRMSPFPTWSGRRPREMWALRSGRPCSCD
ncbi:hypothetical protein N7457_006469 [Penicillium paradoxum]|uniref:uncharacterized protein n=1 Tax=Penicillium paradoxum TaxID=176176 RepID=UPI00254698AB|nr:uncharacterized protein N7457_006469 [Penicillium paradoxum]KAJ5781309.1 hypothetical protein N7457_006469 [Penicillium paradoxum]